MSTMNRDAYAKLLAKDLEWLRKQPRTMAREHIEAVLHHVNLCGSLTDDELSALIEACNVTRRTHGEARPPWDRSGHSAHDKLIAEERRRNAQPKFNQA